MDTQKTDVSIYDRIYAEKKDLVFRTALRYLNYDRDAAEEIMQDVFVVMRNHLDKYEGEYLDAWLIVLARNAALNRAEKSAHEIPDRNITLTVDLRESYRSVEEEVIETEETRGRVELADYILKEMYQKNPRWHEAMTLTYCMGKKREDVAAEMEISLVALDGILYRATKWANNRFSADREKI